MSITPMKASHEQIVTDEILKYLGLDRRHVATQALVAYCERYNFDPLLGHVSIIKTGDGPKVYPTRDGMLHVAHQSGQLDGIVIDDLHETENGWGCTVSVWRKDMSHPFTFSAGCGKQEPQARRGNGAEMALARAERRALRRAFNIVADEYIPDSVDFPHPQPPYIDVDETPSELDRRKPLTDDTETARIETVIDEDTGEPREVWMPTTVGAERARKTKAQPGETKPAAGATQELGGEAADRTPADTGSATQGPGVPTSPPTQPGPTCDRCGQTIIGNVEVIGPHIYAHRGGCPSQKDEQV